MCTIKIGKESVKAIDVSSLYSSFGNVANKSLLHSDVWMSIPRNSVGTCWNIEFGVKITGMVFVWSPFTSRALFDEVQVVHVYLSVLMAPMQNSE
jgi:hypothetical protein